LTVALTPSNSLSFYDAGGAGGAGHATDAEFDAVLFAAEGVDLCGHVLPPPARSRFVFACYLVASW
jgi:hypothetical protein